MGFVSRQGHNIFLSCKSPGPALGPSQPPVQWVPDLIGQCMMLTLPSHLVARLRISGTTPPFPLHVLMAWRTAVLFSYTANNTENTGIACLMNRVYREMACSWRVSGRCRKALLVRRPFPFCPAISLKIASPYVRACTVLWRKGYCVLFWPWMGTSVWAPHIVASNEVILTLRLPD